MLEELRIRGLGVIDDAVLPLGPGLTVVTGETGAGKTMVVTGLQLLFGGRGDATRVRAGQELAIIDGRLLLEPESVAASRVADAGGELDADNTLVLRRTVTAAGRSRGFAGGAPVPVSVLADIGTNLFSVHGQSDQLRLTRPAEQRAALDRYGGNDVATYAAKFRAWRAAEDRLADRTARARELARQADVLRHGVAEIAEAAPVPGEDAELRATASRLAHADELRLAARTAHDALLGDADDPASYASDVATLLGIARRSLDMEAADDPALGAMRDRIIELAALVADLGADLVQYGALLDADRLASAITAELSGLAMPEARVTVAVASRTQGAGAYPLIADGASAVAGPDGLDEVEILLQPRPDAPALAVQRGASGGELSRVMLAIEVCLGAAGKDVPTLVFDEVDAGVGGRAAVEVGRRLARLAQDYQVIVVTHLPQVAAYADQQVVIDKPEDSANRGVSAVRVVDGADRVAELARMLAGSDTETARQHAAELLTSAAADLGNDGTHNG